VGRLSSNICSNISAMPLPLSALDRAWVEAEASLPVGWRLSGLVRDPDEWWRAWALPGPHAGDPTAAPIEGHGEAPIHALQALARIARPLRGSASG
jgi:hypothetical protein